MEYTLRVSKAAWGDVIPLYKVAETMSRHAASGYGTLPLHGPTLKNIRAQRISLLFDEAMRGCLPVCDEHGRGASAEDLIHAAEIPDDWGANGICALFVRVQHLTEWAGKNGDVFRLLDSPVKVIDFDLKNENGDVVHPGYFRGFVDWGDEQADPEPQERKGNGKLVTPEQIADVQAYRDAHGPGATARHFNISTALVKRKTKPKTTKQKAANLNSVWGNRNAKG